MDGLSTVMTNKTLDFNELHISESDVFEPMGYHGAKPDDATLREVTFIIDNVRTWLRPQYCYMVTRELPPFELGDIIMRQLRGSEAYALFLCTAGMEFERYQQRLKAEGDMLRTFIADALGSVIAERTADRMEQHVQESIQKLGWRHTNRFSPGYCGWHVSEQQRLFPLFGAQTCGISLTDSSLMIPIKSVSGVMGVGEGVRKLEYTCGLCTFEKCYKRKVRTTRKQCLL